MHLFLTYFQYYSLFIFIVSLLVMVIVSFMTETPSEEKIRDLSYATMSEDHKASSKSSWGKWDVINSGVVLLLILAAYLYFTG